MKLQLALDRLSWDRCFQLIEEVGENIDIIEVGTGVIKEYGMAIVREIHKRYPKHEILADMKTCDAGKHEAKQAFSAGADITTVMAFSADLTIKDTLEVAEDAGGEIMIDLLEVDSRNRVEELLKVGVQLVSLHLGKDRQQQEGFQTDLFSLVKGLNLKIAVAGGVNLESLPQIIKEKPDIIIVGSAITGADNPKEVARQMKNMIS